MFDASWFALQIEFFAVWTGVLCAIVLGWLILFIIIAVWVYRDAESRGLSGVLWLIVVVLLGLIGIIIYLIVRGGHPVLASGGRGPAPPGYPPPGYAPPPPTQPAAPPANCGTCGAALAAGATFCASCGTKV
jgi:hypothetical protein